MGTYEEYKQFIYLHGYNEKYWKYNEIKEFFKTFTSIEIKTYNRELHNLLSKRTRIRNHIKNWKELYFYTFTINNYHKEKSKRTLTDKIKKIFNGTNYIANEDYGKTTKRLHYHILCEESVDTKTWTYGYTLMIKCKTDIKDKKRLSSYLTKLANHSIKKDTGKLIYGRKKIQKNIKNNGEN